MQPTIEQVIAAIPAWAGRPVAAERIPAGLTNSNYRVVVEGNANFVRIPGTATDLLAVDRGNELHNTRAAAEAGVSPRVLHAIPEWDAFVLEWLDATTMSIEGLRRPGMPSRIAETLRRLHAGPSFRDTFDMFRLSERYLAARRRTRDPDPSRVSRADGPDPADRGGPGRHPASPGPVPQRPARRELPG